MAEALRLFQLREKRRVDVTHSDVQLNKRYYAVRPEYRGDWVWVRYDPFGRAEEVELYSLTGVYLQRAPRYDRGHGKHPFPLTPKEPGQTTPLDHQYLKLLLARYQEQVQAEAAQGMKYPSATERMTLAQVADSLAKLLGRQGGASGLSTEELELLASVQQRHPRITLSVLRQACERAEPKTLPVIVFQLQQLLRS